MDQATAITTISDLVTTWGGYAIAVVAALLTATFLYDAIILGSKKVYGKFVGKN